MISHYMMTCPHMMTCDRVATYVTNCVEIALHRSTRRYRGTEEARQAEREELAQTQLCLLEYLDLDDRVATYVTKHVEIAL